LSPHSGLAVQVREKGKGGYAVNLAATDKELITQIRQIGPQAARKPVLASGRDVVLFIFVLVVRPVAFRALRVSWPGSYRNTKAQK